MWGFLVIYLAEITSVLGHSDESALLQTKSIVHEHTDTQAVSWEENKSTYCMGNWDADWASRTVKSLTACKASCAASASCVAITIGTYGGVANNCVLCTSSTYDTRPWPTTYMKEAAATANCDTSQCTTVDAGNPGAGNLVCCPSGQIKWGDGSACTGGGQPNCATYGNPDLPRCSTVTTEGVSLCEEQVVVEVTGDPHMRNLNGEVFDLSREGKHVLIQIPAGSGEKLEVIGTVTAFHKERKCPTFFMTQLKMKGSMVGEEGIQIVSDPEHFGVKLGAATEFLNIDSTSSTAAGVAQVQRCDESNVRCRSTHPGRRTPNYANKLLVQLPSSITLVASNYASAKPSFMNLAVSGLAAQDDVGGLLGHDDHSMLAGEPECETSSRVQKISMLQLEDGTTVGHLTL